MVDLDPGPATRHLDKGDRTVEADGMMSEVAECNQVTPGSTAKIEDAVGTGPAQLAEKSVDVLGDVVVSGSLPEVFGAALIVFEGRACDLVERGLWSVGHREIIPERDARRSATWAIG